MTVCRFNKHKGVNSSLFQLFQLLFVYLLLIMQKKEIKGLGDVVEVITQKTGIKKIVPKNYGCDKRRKKLNKLVPFKKPIPTDEDTIRVMEEQVKEVLTSYKNKP